MNSYADVALPVGVDKAFTYLLPADLQASAAIGVRAIVPFGRKYVTGLITGLPASTSVTGLKPIKDIIDASPVVSDELLKLCSWISEYYFAPLGEVLKAALPHGFSSSSKRLVRSLVSLQEVENTRRSASKHSTQRHQVLSLLSGGGPLFSRDLQTTTGIRNINPLLNELEREGLIASEEILPTPKQAVKTHRVVLLRALNDSQIETYLAGLSPRKKRIRQLLAVARNLQQQGIGEVVVTDLIRQASATSSTLKELAKAGLLLTERREVNRQEEYGIEQQTLEIVLNEQQKSVLGQIESSLQPGNHTNFLLHGVTGSGKTQVYIEAIRQCLALGRSAIVLVPEISLTPQIVRRFKSHFNESVAVVHSQMSIGERYDVWRLARRGVYKIVIGPRSAIFAPLNNIGLIIVDEEHEASYKQFDASPRYQARDVAVVRGSNCKATVILGSATPSLESYHNASTGKYALLTMPERIDRIPMPSITVVDMTAERKRDYATLKESLTDDQRAKLREFQQSFLSSLLREKIADRLNKKEGIILLQNRRGFAPFVECMDCGYTESCEHCNVTLTYHLAKKHLRCHYCGHVRAPHDVCPQCNGPSIRLQGVGTQKVELELAKIFPEAKVLRMDLDSTTRKGAHERMLKKFGEKEADILLGTQMVAKGLDFPHVTLVGVISADTQMLLPDFRASERTFQLLTQVAGRAGRSTLLGEVLIQTHQPHHYVLQHVIDHDYHNYYQDELEARRELDYPPVSRIILVEVKGADEHVVRQQAERFANALKKKNGAFSILGPSPAVIGKINNQYRWHVILKSRKLEDPSGSHLRHAVRATYRTLEPNRQDNTRVIIDVDPAGLL